MEGLLKCLDDENSAVHRAATEVLGDLGDSSDLVVQALLEHTNDRRFRVRVGAVQALSKIGQREDIATALEACQHRNQWVCEAAKVALQGLFSRELNRSPEQP